MKRVVQLVDGRTRTECDALLMRDVGADRLQAIEDAWQHCRDKTLFASEAAVEWNWAMKKDAISNGALLLCELTCDESPQGAMAVATSPRSSRLTQLSDALYVEYLESAPWNIKKADRAIVPRYFGVGLVLMAEAVLISRHRGFEGRIGLHSLPDAEPFYRDKCRFTEIGPDDAEKGLVYFECTHDQANALLEITGQST